MTRVWDPGNFASLIRDTTPTPIMEGTLRRFKNEGMYLDKVDCFNFKRRSLATAMEFKN